MSLVKNFLLLPRFLRTSAIPRRRSQLVCKRLVLIMLTCILSMRRSMLRSKKHGKSSRNSRTKVVHKQDAYEGLARNIGVSNFRIQDIQRILKIAKHKPVVNQIEFHPYLQQNKLRKFHAENDILTEAYAPLVPLTMKKDGPLTTVVERIAKEQGKTPAQVSLLRLLTPGFVEMVFAKGCSSGHYVWKCTTSEGTA